MKLPWFLSSVPARATLIVQGSRHGRARGLLALLVLLASSAHGEYCIDWKSWLQQSSGRTGACWPTESECSSYYFSRCLNSLYKNDCAGMCYFKEGMYPRTGQKKGGQSAAPGTAPAPENDAFQKKMEAQKKAEAAAQDQQFRKDQQGLLGTIKGDVVITPANRIELKQAPAAGTARQQLDCAANEARNSRNEKGPDWDNPGAGCTPAAGAVPPVPAPTEVTSDRYEVPTDPALRAQFLAWMAGQLTQARQNLAESDRTIAAREQEVAREEKKAQDETKKPAGESDALKKAREALARAKADRERTATELRRLEQQESAAKEKTAAPAGGGN
ncbi:MAG: hypothetical protein PSX71_05765 [bacterium]|nr:hypothetical protein [bacterium]